MLLFLRIILGVSFFGIAGIVVREKMRYPELRHAIINDLKGFLRKFTFFKGKKHSRADFSPSSHALPSVLTSHALPFVKKLFRWITEQCRSLLLFLALRLKTLPRRLRKGLRLFIKDMQRVGRALAVYLFHKGMGIAQTVRQDLRMFELPKHKEDFFDRLQEEKQETRRPLGDHHRRQESSPALNPLKTKSADEAILAPATAVMKENLPVFQTEEVGDDYAPEPHADTELFHQKEEQLLAQIMKDPRNPSSYKKLGKIYLHLENWKDARQCFEYAMKLGARDPELHQLLTQTQQGRSKGEPR